MLRWLTRVRVALGSMMRPNRLEHELDAELRYHLDREIEEGVRQGLTPRDARATALRAMGAVEKHKEECRDLRPASFLSSLLADLRYAGRGLRRSPGFAALAIGIMALGIGANTAVFSVVNAVILQPLPYPGADRIVTIATTLLPSGDINPLVTAPNFRDWRDHSTSFEAMAVYRGGEYGVSAGTTTEYARLSGVDDQFFQVFRVEPLLGRTFGADDLGRAVGVISHAYWQNGFGADPGVLGRTMRVSDDVLQIVGVMPPGFSFPAGTDVWVPGGARSASRTRHYLLAVGRLAPGVPLERAQAELTGIAANLEQQFPESNKGRGVTLARLQDQLVGDVRPTLYLLWAVVGVVLLIACANTATLLLGKATARTREVAVRTALGASRRRIIRQLVTESLLLALVAGAAGMTLAYWGVRLLVALSPADVVRVAGIGIDAGVLGFTLGISIATSFVFGLLPALHASRVNVTGTINQSSTRGVAGGRLTRTRSVLVAAEVALAVLLLTGAGLLLKSLVALHAVDLGFRPGNVLVMRATAPPAFFTDLLPRLAALPGVVAAGATSIPPGDLALSGSGFYFIDRVPEQRDRTVEPTALLTIVAPGSFDALGIPITQGRDFDAGDSAQRPLVAIVNEALVRRSFTPGVDPIGRTIFCHFDRDDAMTIVGVVGDARQRNPASPAIPECFMPYTQHAYNGNTLNVVVRTAGEPGAYSGTVRRLAAASSPDVPVAFTTMADTVSAGLEHHRFRALLFALFAVLALALAMAGVYGVLAYAVEQRSREIGLRMALGASRGSVLQLIIGQGLAPALVGLVLGLAAAAAATRVLETMLFDVRPLDAAVYVGVAAGLGVVTLAAGYLPARRAATVDPVRVLQTE